MLHKLSIRNYAIIDRLDIEFGERMNIITGETGAGKSILLGALGLILGERADTKVLYNPDDKCVVEADFDVTGYKLKSFFGQHELDYEAHTIIRREINQSGKSRAFINDTPVTLAVLKELGEKLVNLHSQHETLELTRSGFQLQVVDSLAGNAQLLAEYRTAYNLYKKDAERLQQLTESQRTAAAELDYLQFQLNELAEAQLQPGEQETLETEQQTLNNVDEIKQALQHVTMLLQNGDFAVLDQLSEMQSRLKNVRNYNSEITQLSERLQSAFAELKDITAELNHLQDSISLDPERLMEVESRLDTLYRLLKKHGTTTADELLALQTDLETRVSSVNGGQEEITRLQQQLATRLAALLQQANALHAARHKVLREFQNNVVVMLTKVGMPNASFKVDIQQPEQSRLNENGLTEIKFLFSANKGFAPQEIKDVASGGELSRLMLSVKSLIADAGAMPTMIFDEIDNGISGEVALRVGEIMKKLSAGHQLIAITHLPQIARTADVHLYIYKEVRDGRTYTRIKELTPDERVMEVAKMLSGEKPTDAALANAREMIYG